MPHATPCLLAPSCSLKAWLLTVAMALLGVAACQTAPLENHLLVGNQYAQDGLLREAVDSYKAALASNSRNLAAHRNLGMVLVKVGNYKKAITHLSEAMKVYQEDFDANYYLAEAYRGEENFADASFHYQKALRLRSDDPKALKALAWTYFKIRYYSEALTTAHKLAKQNPDDLQTSIIMARTLLKLKRYKEAQTVLRSARSRNPEANAAYFSSVEGDIYLAMGDLNKAGRLYHLALKEQPFLAGALVGLGKCLLSERKNPEAITYLERAIRLRPSFAEAHFLLGKAYENKDKDKSLRHYLSFHKYASSDPEFLSLLAEVKRKIMALRREPKPKQHL